MLKLGFHCLGLLKQRWTPSPFYTKHCLLSPQRSLSHLSQKHIFAPRAEGCAARRREACTELGPGFRPSSTSFDVGIAKKGCGAGHSGPANCQLRGSSYVGRSTRSGNHIRSWCGGHRPAPRVRQCLEGKA